MAHQIRILEGEQSLTALPDTNNPNGDALPVLILGTTLFSEEIAELVHETPGLSLAGFVENMARDKCQQTLLGQRVHWVEELAEADGSQHLLCGIGTTKRRLYVEQVSAYGLPFATLQHPTAHISASSRIGAGSILGVNTIVAAHSEVGEHVIVNRAAAIGHHTQIGDYVTIGPGANIAGRCVIGSGSYIGMGAIIIDGLKIGSNSVVGAGAVVTRDVPDNVQVVGIPARVIKEGINGR
jgi:sugar O-acyltransferase (sialic acid O-acetyltransferase NeuD family)